MKKVLFSLILLLLVTGCATETATATNVGDITFRVLSQGQSSGLTQQKFLTLRSTTEFAEFWRVHTAINPAPLPKINFQKHMIIAVFMGEQRTGGYAISIEKITELEKELQVLVRLVKPKPNTNRIMMITQPHMIVALARSNKSVTFKFRSAP
jgi:hypothetical protein